MVPAIPQFLVTAGNTREMIDRVRDWGNIFTGNTGLAIARALAADLGPVHLLTSNRQHIEQVGREKTTHSIHAHAFTTHTDLKQLLSTLLAGRSFDAIFMTAAVADYRPAGVFSVISQTANPDGTQTWTVKDVQAAKVKSTHPNIAVLGQPTEKLVDLFRTKWNHKGLLFKFKLEVGTPKEALLQIAQSSRQSSGADYLVANTLEMVEGEGAGAYLISEKDSEFIPRANLAARLAQLVRERLNPLLRAC
jgi:phosphopantothenoylcysteine synthetase/decarboxylase